MDELATYNKERWEELARSGVEFSRPYLHLDASSAREIVDPWGMLGDIAEASVLCLASGGGQQSAAFGLLGARVTVFDLSETQLHRDQETATHYGLDIRTIQGDMRDLAQLSDHEFDIVWQPYSINFVPHVTPVFREVSRVIRSGGHYYLQFGNPFTFFSVDNEAWNGQGYPLRYPYVDGAEVTSLHPDFEYWDVETEEGRSIKVRGPKEFRHTLSTVINGLVRHGFVILRAWEAATGDPSAEPGTWGHYQTIAPPWLSIWATCRPEILEIPWKAEHRDS